MSTCLFSFVFLFSVFSSIPPGLARSHTYFVEETSNEWTPVRQTVRQANPYAEDQEFILRGIEIIKIDSAGFLSVYGPAAFPLVVGHLGSGDSAVLHPIAAGSRLGKGRIIGIVSASLTIPEDDSSTGNRSGRNQFLLNAINWVSSGSGSDSSPTGIGPRIAYIGGYFTGFKNFITKYNMTATSINLNTLTSLTAQQLLASYDVIVTRDFFQVKHVPILKEFIESGGGFFCSVNSWAWSSYVKVDPPFSQNFPLNMVSGPSGFVWQDGGGGIKPTTPDGNNYNASTELLRNIHIMNVWNETKQFFINRNNLISTPVERNSLLQLLYWGFKGIPPNDPIFFRESWFYTDLLNITMANWQPLPSSSKPVVIPEEKFALQVFHVITKSALKSEDVPAHPSSKNFPGSILENGETFPEEVSIELSRSHSGWVSTGFYAPAGKHIVVSISPEGNFDKYEVLIGCHTDDLSKKSQWKRPAWLTIKQKFVGNEVRIASPYGGILYIIFPSEAVSPGNFHSVRILGAVPTPYFKLGKNSNAEWREKLRYAPGPWAELATEKIILSVPSVSVRQLDDPESVLLFWDQVMDANADLGGTSRERVRPERFVPDIDISNGYMHSGYPIMSRLDVVRMVANLTRLKAGLWGHFHELGHNCQKSEWTFGGTGEVTNNIFAVHVYNAVLGIPEELSSTNLAPGKIRRLVEGYVDRGKNFEEWKKDPWLALKSYLQLQKEFGWDAFKEVFRRYTVLDAGLKPKTDADKIDLWMQMFSWVVGKDLSGYFKSWGIPIRDNASSSTSGLPSANIFIEDLLKHPI